MRRALESRTQDFVLSDWSMPKFSAMGALDVLKKTGKDLPFIIVSGTVGEESAVDAMHAGAHDYVLKDKLGRLGPAIERERRECKARGALREAQRRFSRLSESGIIGINIADIHGNILEANDAYMKMVGYSRQDPFQSWDRTIHGLNCARSRDARGRRMKRRRSASGQHNAHQASHPCRLKVKMSGLSQMKMSGSGTGARHVAGLPNHEQTRAGSTQLLLLIHERRRMQAQVAEQLGMTVRHVERLFRAYKDGGAAALVSKKRGRPSARRLSDATRAEVLRVVRERYADFGPTLAHEKLTELQAATVSVETLRQWMIGAGIWLPRAQRRKGPHRTSRTTSSSRRRSIVCAGRRSRRTYASSARPR